MTYLPSTPLDGLRSTLEYISLAFLVLPISICALRVLAQTRRREPSMEGTSSIGREIGSWIGREGKGGQAWLTYWLSPRESIQLGYRNAKVAAGFIPGGTTQNDFSLRAVVRLKNDLELTGFAQYEAWKAPVLAPGRFQDFTSSVQLGYFPKLRWRR